MNDEGKPIVVTSDKSINRLIAYLHQKGVTGHVGVELRAESGRLKALMALTSSAHEKDAVNLEDAKLAFFSIYSLLGELVQRTDCEPVTEYR